MEPGTVYIPRSEEERTALEELFAHTSTPEFAAYLASGQYRGFFADDEFAEQASDADGDL